MSEKLTMPQISIIMPCHNDGEYLHHSVNSVLAQDFQDWELIIADDRSDTGTRDVIADCTQRDARIKSIHLDEYTGGNAGRARNAALPHARGRYIAFLDADDCWYAHKLSRQLEFMQKKSAHLCTTHTDIIDAKGNVIGHYRRARKIVSRDEMLIENLATTSSVMIDRKVHTDILFPDIKRAQDYACWMALLSGNRKMHIQHEALAQYRIERAKRLILRKPREAYYRWRVYRECLNLPFSTAIRSLIGYIFKGFQKTRAYTSEKGNDKNI